MRNLLKTFNLGISYELYALNISCLMLINILCIQPASSQKLNENSELFNIKNFKEELYIRTDRDIYITGEQVWFKVYERNSLNHTPWDISKVAYLELLDKNNFPLRQLKIKTDGKSGSSVFILPENISSGNYIIRAYTNWMKNWTTDLFYYKTISVINPFENIDHLKLPSDSVIADPGDDPSHFIVAGENKNKLPEWSSSNDGNKHFNYNIVFQKQEHSARENVKIAISATDMAGNPVETNMSVSVAKSVTVNFPGMSGTGGFNDPDYQGNTFSRLDYLPELEGHLISGSMRLKATDEPLVKTDISLSYVGKTARCQFGKTNENGEFNFVVKEPGVNEIVIQPLSPDVGGYYIDLNQPFSDTFSDFEPATFYLDSSKISEINNVIISMQINNIYEPFRHEMERSSGSAIPDFYGKPENTIRMSDYIELTSLREVIKEIIPNVYTQKQNGKYDFKLINKFRGQPFENKPLVLVDGVPIYDLEKVLGINSKEIERADIINTRYFYSENIFDGIVSFITKKGNLSAMEFDNSIFRQVYEGCQIKKNFYSPDYSTSLMKESRIPDYRNTLYWNPDLRTTKDGKTEIEFFTSDESVEYTIIVEGISSAGTTGFSTATLNVKNRK